LTRSGTNSFHGTLFEYFRNSLLDANDWFANYNQLPKPQERQNDFGGVVGGPVIKDKTFFFFSYEGLRLLMPQTTQGIFFAASVRAAVAPVFQPIVNALPLPTGLLIDPTCDNITNPCLASVLDGKPVFVTAAWALSNSASERTNTPNSWGMTPSELRSVIQAATASASSFGFWKVFTIGTGPLKTESDLDIYGDSNFFDPLPYFDQLRHAGGRMGLQLASFSPRIRLVVVIDEAH
jgi:hypothetical protein